jgi:hypothetical protein
MIRWYKPRGLAADDPENYFRCTANSERAAYGDPAAWEFIDTDGAMPSPRNAGYPMLALCDPPPAVEPPRPADEPASKRLPYLGSHPGLLCS